MLSFVQATRIAAAWVAAVTDDTAALDREQVVALPYGWIFPWNSQEFIADRSNWDASLIGNVPIFIDRVNGELLVTGTDLAAWREKYEESLPTARLLMRPEPIRWQP